MRFRWASSLVCGLLVMGAAPASRALGTAPPAETRGAVRLIGVGLRAAVETVLKDSPYRCFVDPDVPEVAVDLIMREVTPTQALRLVTRQASAFVRGLTLSRSGDTYRIRVRAQVPEEASGGPRPVGQVWDTRSYLRVSGEYRNRPFGEVVRELLEPHGLRFTIAPALADVHVDVALEDISLPLALGRVVRQAARAVPGASFHRGSDEAYVFAAEPLVSAQFRETPLRQALDALLPGARRRYALEAGVPDVPITLDLRDVGRAAALRRVTDQAARSLPGLTFFREGDQYVFRLMPPSR